MQVSGWMRNNWAKCWVFRPEMRSCVDNMCAKTSIKACCYSKKTLYILSVAGIITTISKHTTMSTTTPTTKHVHYVIVVHGIGEQRPNETVLAVINRLAEARACDATGSFPPKGAYVSMGKVAAQVKTQPKQNDRYSFSGTHPWAQFEGIPAMKGAPVTTFTAEQSNGPEDIRFADMFWADILNDYFTVSGHDVGPWTDGVISRMVTKDDLSPDQTWIVRLLEQVQETALFAETVAGLPGVNYSEPLAEVMDSFVGDIQIYGENRSVRGRAVRRFHNLMEKLHGQHCAEYCDAGTGSGDDRYMGADGVRHVPKFTIVAHSLGTIMSLDAIMYAHLRKDEAYPSSAASRESAYRNLPFEEYDEKHLYWSQDTKGNPIAEPSAADQKTAGPYIGSNWVDNLEAFVTLGSPIDKYLTLWPENYQYLAGTPYASESKPDVSKLFYNRPDGSKIRHYNYCDEQDPVGHHLDVLTATPSYPMVFEHVPDRDVVFNSYQIPGVAHVMYWDDQELFQRIMHQAIDHDEARLPSGQEFAASRESMKTYWTVMLFTYYLPALIAGIVMAMLFLWGWESMKNGSWKTGLIAAVVFSLAGYVFKKLISMLIWWRQILRKKQELKQKSYPQAAATGTFRATLLLGNIVLIAASVWFVVAAIAVACNTEGYDWAFVVQYLLALVGAGAGVYLLGKSSWSKNWMPPSKASLMPERMTVVGAVVIGGIVAGLLLTQGSAALESWGLNLKQPVLTSLAAIFSGLSLAWMYAMFSIPAIKRQL